MPRRVARSDAVLALIAAILLAIWFVIPERELDRQQALIDWSQLAEQSPQTIFVEQAGIRLDFVLLPKTKSASRYVATNYHELPTDPAVVDHLLRALTRIEIVRPIATEESTHGLDRPKLVIGVGASDGKRSIVLGAPAASPPGARYARIVKNDRSRIVVLAPTTATELDIEPYSLLEHRVLDVVPSEIRQIALEGANAPTRLERSPNGRWLLDASRGTRAHRAVVQRLLLDLTGISVTKFLEPSVAQVAQHGAALRTLSLRAERDARITESRIFLGGRCPGSEPGVVLRRDTPRQLSGCIDQKVFEKLNLKRDDFLDPAAFSLHADEVERLDVSGLGPTWTLTRQGAAFRLRADRELGVTLQAGNSLLAAITSVRGTPAGPCRFSKDHHGPRLSIRSYVVGVDGPTDERLQWGLVGADGRRSACRDDGTKLELSAEEGGKLDIAPNLLRDPRLVDVSVDSVTRVRLETPAGRQRLQVDARGDFTSIEPRLGPIDAAAAETLREKLAQLQAIRWLPESSSQVLAENAMVEFQISEPSAIHREGIGDASTDPDGGDAGLAPFAVPTGKTPPKIYRLHLSLRPSAPALGRLEGVVTPFVVDASLAEVVENLSLEPSMLRLSATDRTVTLSRGPDKITLTRDGSHWQANGTPAARCEPETVAKALEAMTIDSVAPLPTVSKTTPSGGSKVPIVVEYGDDRAGTTRPRLRFMIGPKLVDGRGSSARIVTRADVKAGLVLRETDLAALLALFPDP